MAEEKPSNPKDALGVNKVPLHLWPMCATVQGSMALLDGALKYGRANWRVIGVRSSIYYDATLRHLGKWFEGEERDENSGLSHLAHALACLAIVIDAQEAGKLVDDRQYPGGNLTANMEEASKTVRNMRFAYDHHTPKHYTLADTIASAVEDDKGDDDIPF